MTSSSNATQPATTTVVLFDIDGTILWSDGAGRRAVHTVLREVFGSTGPANHRFDGKTDRQIVRELMTIAGHDDAHIDSRMEHVMTRYLEELRDELKHPDHPPQRFAGVVELLDALEARHDVVLGLLTGNLEEGAHEKLRAVGIDPSRFRVNAYGSDAENRPDLPPVARQRARELLGADLAGDRFVVIGDTPNDMTCGRGIGARAIGVATGRYSTAELAAHGAWAVFEDLRDTDAVVRAVVGEPAARR
jgi:phosphoglycolate phosphatase-like HAD superfamily hydrolase